MNAPVAVMDKATAKAKMAAMAKAARVERIVQFTAPSGDCFYVWFDKSGGERWAVNRDTKAKAKAFAAMVGGAA